MNFQVRESLSIFSDFPHFVKQSFVYMESENRVHHIAAEGFQKQVP